MPWILQVREPDQMLDVIVPLGPYLPDYVMFHSRCQEQNLKLPKDFAESYFRPAVFALNKIGDEGTPYVAFNVEGRIMCIMKIKDK